ncbi:MAG: hypothetical protein JSU03_01685, partial [Bacteroidetes bacterium]|nr:hypothetical protein [Bacteroidota bacterium]
MSYLFKFFLSKPGMSNMAMLVLLFSNAGTIFAQSSDTLSQQVQSAEMINPTTAEVIFTDKHRLSIDFYGENIFRLFEDPTGGIIRNPVANPPAN